MPTDDTDYSYDITPLVIISLKVDTHTYARMHTHIREQKQLKETKRTGHAWL